MEKNNYQIYVEKRQKEVLLSTCTLHQAIGLLRHRKEHLSPECYEASCEMISLLFDLSYDEIDKAVDGEKYWISKIFG